MTAEAPAAVTSPPAPVPALAVIVLLVAAVTAGAAWFLLRPAPPARVEGYPEAPEFSVAAHDGTTLKRDDLRGRPWLAAFVFTRCTTVCPVLTTRLADLGKSLPAPVRIVTFSVDTDYDTPAVLKKHAEGLGVDPKRWLFGAFGGRPERDRVVKAFFLTVEDQPGVDPGESIIHDSRVALVDPEGRVRGWYDSNDPAKVAALRRDVAALAMTGLYAMPAVNATLNATSFVLLVAALLFIRAGKREFHVAFVLGALAASAGFLACYLTYHAMAGSTKFAGEGRSLYLALLASHTILAALVPPLVGVVVWKAWKRDWERHKKWAHVAVPAWLYVSVTGVTIYWWLFRA